MICHHLSRTGAVSGRSVAASGRIEADGEGPDLIKGEAGRGDDLSAVEFSDCGGGIKGAGETEADGEGDAAGEADGDGDGVGLGDGEAAGLGEADADGEGEGLRLGDGLGEGERLGVGLGDGEAPGVEIVASAADLSSLLSLSIVITSVLLVKFTLDCPVVSGLTLIVAKVPLPCLPPESGGAARVKLILPLAIVDWTKTIVRKSPAVTLVTCSLAGL